MAAAKKIFGLFIAAVAIVSCGDGRRAASEEAEELRREIQYKDSLINNVFYSLNEITANLNVIRSRENLIAEAVGRSSEIGREPTSSIRSDLAAIDQLLLENRETIDRLRANGDALRKANVKLDSFERLLSAMSEQVSTKDEEITELREMLLRQNIEIDELSDHIGRLTEDIEGLSEDNRQLKEKEEMLYTAYYILGSRKELLKKGIIDKEGFIVRNRVLNQNAGLDGFTRVDLRNFDEVLIGWKNVELVTNHPDGSYEFVMGKKGIFQSLVITDRERFWSYSKVLVISHR